MLIELTSVGKPYVKDKYGRLDIEYITGGKQQKKTLTAVAETKNVVNVLKDASVGDSYEIKLEKDGQYWNWVDAVQAGQNEEKPVKTHFQAGTKGNWETPEERAARQVYIIKQSSLANAISFQQAFSANPTSIEDVLEVAQVFTDWVLGNEAEPKVKKTRSKKDHEVENSDPFKED